MGGALSRRRSCRRLASTSAGATHARDVSASAPAGAGTAAAAAGERALRIGAWIGIAAGAALLAVTLARGERGISAVLAGFLGLAAAFAGMGRTVPAVASFPFACAIVYAAAGWAFDLFRRVELFDELAHALFGFALTPAIAFLVLGPWLAAWPAHRLRLGVATVSLGVAAGAVWEMAEWLVRTSTGNEAASPSLSDAITDMMLGGIGSVASLVTVWWGIRATRRGAAR